MGIRKVVNEHSYLTVFGASLVLLISIAAMLRYRSSPGVPYAKLAFYSIDDGQSWFADDVNQLPPFDHDGKSAVRAYVWNCNGRSFTCYVERLTETAKQKLAALRLHGPVGTDAIQAINLDGLQVKRPGDPTWHSQRDPEYRSIVTPTCACGSSDDLAPVYP